MRNTQENGDKFFPCYLDISRLEAINAWGWKPINTHGNTSNKNSLYEYLKTLNYLTDKFSDDKLMEMTEIYFRYHDSIMEIQRLAKQFLAPISMRKSDHGEDNQSQLITYWQNTLYQVYEKYWMANSEFDRNIYEMVLTGLMWNPNLDPRDPRIQDVNIKRVDALRGVSQEPKLSPLIRPEEETESESNIIQEVSNPINESIAPVVKKFFKKNINKISSKFNQYNFDIDEDGRILVKKNFKADLQRYYSNSNRLIKIYRSENNLDKLKPELAKLWYINELIETKYIHNPKMTDEERKEAKSFISLRANVLSSFKEYLIFVMKQDSSFVFSEYYENSPYAEVLVIKREQIRGVRDMIAILLGAR